jgi:hypothetical protein
MRTLICIDRLAADCNSGANDSSGLVYKKVILRNGSSVIKLVTLRSVT